MKSSPPKTGPEPGAPILTPGMAALLRPGNGGAKSETQSQAQAAQVRNELPPGMPWPKWILPVSLVLADVLLLGLVAMLLLAIERPLGFLEMLIAVIAVAVGAWLSFLALWWGRKKEPRHPQNGREQ